MDFTSMSLEQFHHHFVNEEACFQYVYNSKWPQGFVCPRCDHRHAYVTHTRRLPLYECSRCRHQTSLTAGTLMEGSRTELRKWLIALFLVSRPEQGTTAVELSQIVQVTYKTAWLMLHKIRQVMHAADDQTRLSGVIRVNSAVYGLPYNPSVHKHKQEHLLLVGSSLNEQGESNYVKIKLVTPDYPGERHISRSNTMDFNNKHTESQRSSIETVIGLYSPKRTRPLLKFASQASTWLNKTFHGIGAKHLQSYLDEFTFRLNLSILNAPIFTHLIQLCFHKSTTSLSALRPEIQPIIKENKIQEKMTHLSKASFVQVGSQTRFDQWLYKKLDIAN
ncbi:transposase [Paenibacillus sp. GCM10027628]|uniref:transposase n=1 Tax=Paenibacillus sp. GCM10027628 TaxID=3273413 RepID=UPI0036408E70